MRALRPALGACLLAASSSGCAIDRGGGFATLHSASLEVTLEPGAARDLGDDTVLTDRGYAVRIERAQVRVDSLQLQQVAGGTEQGAFDPSNPPPGYSLCHSGHCHRDDGALVDYEDIEVELAGGAEAFSPIVTLGFDNPLSLLAAKPSQADRYEPSRELERSNPRRVVIALSRIEIEGTVSAGDLGEDELTLTVDLEQTLELDTTLEGLDIDRDGPERIDLTVVVRVEGTLFDDIDFAGLADDERALEDPESPSSRTLTASLAASGTKVALSR